MVQQHLTVPYSDTSIEQNMLHIIIYILHLCAHEMDGCKYEDAVYYCTYIGRALMCVLVYAVFLLCVAVTRLSIRDKPCSVQLCTSSAGLLRRRRRRTRSSHTAQQSRVNTPTHTHQDEVHYYHVCHSSTRVNVHSALHNFIEPNLDISLHKYNTIYPV